MITRGDTKSWYQEVIPRDLLPTFNGSISKSRFEICMTRSYIRVTWRLSRSSNVWSLCASDLRHDLDIFKTNMRALKTSGHQSNAKIFQLNILLSKLDPARQQKFEAKLSTVKEIPRLQDLYDMLEKRVKIIEVKSEPVQLSRKFSKPDSRKKSSLHVSSRNLKCHVCEMYHLVY